MNRRHFSSITVIILGLIAVYIQLFDNQGFFTNNNTQENRQKIFPHLLSNNIDTIIISNRYGKLTLHKKAQQWHIKEKEDYPASNFRINEIIIALADLSVTQTPNIAKHHWKTLNLLDSKQCQFDGCGNKIELIAKDTYYVSLISGDLMLSNSEAASIFGEDYDGRQFVRVPANDQVYLVDQSLPFLNTMTASWIMNTWATTDHNRSIIYVENGNILWQLLRNTPDAPYTLIGENTQLPVTLPKLTQTVDYTFSSLLIRDVMSSDFDKTQVQLNGNRYIDFQTFSTQTHRLYIGGKISPSKQAEQYNKKASAMLSSTSSSTWRFVSLHWPDGRHNTQGSLPYADRVYLISSSMMDRFLITYDEMLLFEKLSPSLD